jgi:hypothetical protein
VLYARRPWKSIGTPIMPHRLLPCKSAPPDFAPPLRPAAVTFGKAREVGTARPNGGPRYTLAGGR